MQTLEGMQTLIIAAAHDGVEVGELADGHHTFNELYEFRKMYNAALFNEWARSNKYSVHKSKKHYDGKYCFGANGEWFIVVAVCELGQISNHYKIEDWDLFDIQETETAIFEYDGHTSKDVIKRLKFMSEEQ